MAIDSQATAGGRPGVESPSGPLQSIQVSIVLPCLDEAASVGEVVRTALRALDGAGLRGEVIVADNGSDDGSPDIARAAGARVVYAPARGYGNAYHAGMAAACGQVLVMADADGTYPMEDIPRLVAPVLGGEVDMVIGSRLRGAISGGAMPWSHRYIGNPILTGVLNRFFGVQVSDAHSGMRSIDAAAYRRLRLTTPGMEYASEMITQAARARLRIREVPIEYRERVGESKLRTWQDGWRHLKFLLLASPTWLFLVPGTAACLLGALVLIPLTFGEVHIGRFQLLVHPMIPAAVLLIVGYQLVQFGVLLRACTEPPEGLSDRLSDLIHRYVTIERMLVLGSALTLAGLAIGLTITIEWASSGFGPLSALRAAITAMTLFVLGTQTIFGSFLFAFFLPLRFGGGVTRPRSRDVNSAHPVGGPGATEVTTPPVAPVQTTDGEPGL